MSALFYHDEDDEDDKSMINSDISDISNFEDEYLKDMEYSSYDIYEKEIED